LNGCFGVYLNDQRDIKVFLYQICDILYDGSLLRGDEMSFAGCGQNRVIIFDFDDTLVKTTEIFDEVRAEFCQVIEGLGLSVPDLAELVDQQDIENIRKAGGFYNHCFPKALCQVYQYCCQHHQKTVSSHWEKELEQMGWSVFFQGPRLMEHAHEVLQHFGARYPMILVTKGSPDSQTRRIQESGLEKYFQQILIVSDKNEASFKKIVTDLEINPGQSWSIGNSIKADINPSIAAGLKAVHFAGYSWHFEHAEPIGEFQRIESLAELIRLIPLE